MSSAPITKKLMLESQSVNGKCYVRLLSMLPGFKNAPAKNLEHAIIYMVRTLGSNPVGSTIIPELFIIQKMLDGDFDYYVRNEFSPINTSETTQFVSTLMDSTVRYTWEEIAGVQHIGGYIDPGAMTGTANNEVYNEFGYSARFVLCMMINPGTKVGADDSYSNLFDEIQRGANILGEIEDDQINFNDSGLASENEELKVNLNDRLREIERLNNQVNKIQRQISGTSMHQRSPDVDNATMKRFSELFLKQTEMDRKSPKEEVFPEDSSSNLDRYENKYLDDGTIFDCRGDGKTKLSSKRMISSLRPEREVVVGYKKTDEMIVRENRIYKKVNSINGLANPFHSHRLNFLCHFDTAVRSIQIRKESSTHYDVVLWIAKNKSVSPSQELLYQVVTNTFDLKGNRVIANPYKLPFLEVGMILSDDCLVKCFELISLEFKSLWFDKMKSLLVPDFHNEFVKFKDNKLTTNKDKQNEKHTSFTDMNSNIRSRSKNHEKRKSSSILGFIRE